MHSDPYGNQHNELDRLQAEHTRTLRERAQAQATAQAAEQALAEQEKNTHNAWIALSTYTSGISTHAPRGLTHHSP